MVSASERILESPEYENNFYVNGLKLFCKYCQNIILDHTDVEILNKHLKNNKHIKNVEKNVKVTCQYRNVNEREEINIALVRAFTQANIPLEKADSLKDFFHKFCINGDAIVDSLILQEKYLPTAFDIESSKMREIMYSRRLSIIIDETIDFYGRAVVNVFFSFSGQIILAKTEYLNIVNNTSIAQLIMRTLQFYNIPFNNIIFFISENAEYMIRAFQVLSPLMPQLKHNRCLAHILNLVGESWIYYKNFKFLTNIITNIETSFIQCPARKRRWCDLMNSLNFHTTIPFDQNNNHSNELIILPYLPAKSDWISWYRFICWINQHRSQLCTFYIGEEMIDNESEAIRELTVVFKSPLHSSIFEIFIMFIALNAKRIVDELEFFKTGNKPIAPYVIRRLEKLKTELLFYTIQPPFSNEMNTKFLENNIDPKIYIKMFQEAYQLALNKLKNYINHLALPLLNAIQCFDPRYVRTHCIDINSYSEIEEFKNPTNTIIQEWGFYCNLIEEFGNEELDLNIYWINKNEILPNLSKLALDYIWLPVSGV
ncbi:hypothetical protein C1645_838905 [Glomus cerebriforme]|uniref:DUF659 domain-containing protein n=1 Tax=Glomus cerebriforme TaxID=658196 RepID=A0A397S6F0_9GLOM|nr:hypothetical protein C1645_838905 [Glomus cerebriforme]